MNNIPITEEAISLHDGRVLSYAEVGKRNGYPLFHFHGHGSSRLEVSLLAEAASSQNIRLIGLDRPGIGTSTPKHNFHILDWPDDVVEAADTLGIKKFAIEGVSEGGMYALACAYKIPQRLTTCGLISSVTPISFVKQAGPLWMRTVWWIGANLPWLFHIYLTLVTKNATADVSIQEKKLLRYRGFLGEADKTLLDNAEMRRYLARALAESNRQGGNANREEVKMSFKPWGFHVENIMFKNIFLWHGEQDTFSPIAPVRLLVQALPHCKATFYTNEGHFSTLVNHAQDIFTTLNG